MSFPEALKRKEEAVFRRFGEDAAYVSAYGQRIDSARVIRKRADTLGRFGDGQIVTPSCELRFRRSEIATAQQGDRFVFVDDGAEIEYVLHGEPMLDARRRVWSCGADQVDVSR